VIRSWDHPSVLFLKPEIAPRESLLVTQKTQQINNAYESRRGSAKENQAHLSLEGLRVEGRSIVRFARLEKRYDRILICSLHARAYLERATPPITTRCTVPVPRQLISCRTASIAATPQAMVYDGNNHGGERHA
jgi:hypothetical protein